MKVSFIFPVPKGKITPEPAIGGTEWGKEV